MKADEVTTDANRGIKMKRRNDLAVSPVIGVILMVAITVILAAVIAMFVFNMSGNLGTTKTIGVVAQQSSMTTITVTYTGSGMGPAPVNLTVSINGNPVDPIGNTTGEITVGATKTYTGDFGGRDRVLVVGNFGDGTQQIALDQTL